MLLFRSRVQCGECSTSGRSSMPPPARQRVRCRARKPRDAPPEQRTPLFQKFSTSEEESIMYRSRDDLLGAEGQDAFSRTYDEADADPWASADAASFDEAGGLLVLDDYDAAADGAAGAGGSGAAGGPGGVGAGGVAARQLNVRQFAEGDAAEEAGGGAAAGRPQQQRGGAQRARSRHPYVAWYQQPGLTVRALHDLLLQSCERSHISMGPLYTMFALAATPEEARMVLSALATVRLALVQQRRSLRPFSPSFTGKLVRMCVRCGAVEVLLEAMQRCNDLGLDFSLRAVHSAMKHYATNLELEPLEAIFRAMPEAGLHPTAWSRSCLVRAMLNADRLERAQDLLDEFAATRGRVLASTLNLMAYARRRRSARAVLNQ